MRIRFRWNLNGCLCPSNISGDLSDFNRVVRIFRTTPLRRKRQRQSRRRIRMQAFGETSHHQRTSGESLLQSRLAERAVQTRSIISLIFPNLAFLVSSSKNARSYWRLVKISIVIDSAEIKFDYSDLNTIVGQARKPISSRFFIAGMK